MILRAHSYDAWKTRSPDDEFDDEHDCVGYCVEVAPGLFECAMCGLRYDTANLQDH